MSSSSVLQGTLDLLVLKVLSRASLHGYGIAVQIKRISQEELRVEEGSLYPALHRMEQSGWISSEWRPAENGRKARYYRMTAKGRKTLAEQEERWGRVSRAVARVLRTA
jgi:PadR family transcriptional regulator PadR